MWLTTCPIAEVPSPNCHSYVSFGESKSLALPTNMAESGAAPAFLTVPADAVADMMTGAELPAPL